METVIWKKSRWYSNYSWPLKNTGPLSACAVENPYITTVSPSHTQIPNHQLILEGTGLLKKIHKLVSLLSSTHVIQG